MMTKQLFFYTNKYWDSNICLFQFIFEKRPLQGQNRIANWPFKWMNYRPKTKGKPIYHEKIPFMYFQAGKTWKGKKNNPGL